MSKELLNPTSPGEMLVEEFLKPLGISAHKLAMDTHVPASRIDEIVKGRRGITADTAIRFSLYFGNSAEFWMNLQSQYDLEMTKREKLKAISREIVHT